MNSGKARNGSRLENTQIHRADDDAGRQAAFRPSSKAPAGKPTTGRQERNNDWAGGKGGDGSKGGNGQAGGAGDKGHDLTVSKCVPVEFRHNDDSEAVVQAITRVLRDLGIRFTGKESGKDLYCLFIYTDAVDEALQLVAAAVCRTQSTLVTDLFPAAVENLRRAHEAARSKEPLQQQQPQAGAQNHKPAFNGNGRGGQQSKHWNGNNRRSDGKRHGPRNAA